MKRRMKQRPFFSVPANENLRPETLHPEALETESLDPTPHVR